MYTLLGLLMYAGQIIGIVVLFGGRDTMPKRMRICTGIMMCFILIALVSFASE